MSEQPAVAVTPGAPAGPAGVTDDQASALLADAIATAEAQNPGTPERLTPEQRMAELPGWARNEINQLRSSKESRQNTADQARNELAQTIGKALGFVQDDEPADPVKLTEQLTAAGADARQAKIELAVFRAAQATDADPSALLDSRAFLVKLAGVDPSDTAAITAAVTEAVTANPRLGKPAVPGMRPNPAQGHSASAPLGLAEQIAASEKAGDTKATIRLKAAMGLNHN